MTRRFIVLLILALAACDVGDGTQHHDRRRGKLDRQGEPAEQTAGGARGGDRDLVRALRRGGGVR